MKLIAKAALGAAAMLLVAGPSWAFPDRPIQLIVPFTAAPPSSASMVTACPRRTRP